MKHLNPAITGMHRSGIREIMDLAWATPGVIHLEVGEPDFATPNHVLDAAARAAVDGYTKYTPNAGIPEVRAAFADKVTARNGFAATAEQVVVTVGAINALVQALMILCEPGDAVLVPDPGWPNYEMQATVAGLRTVRYPLLSEEAFYPDLDALDVAAAASGTAVMILNTPSNPTGAVLDSDTLQAMLEIAARNDLWVISDECYEDIVFEESHVSPASLFDDDRVVSVYSMSKSYAMTGWRVGYAVGPREVASTMAKLTETLTACVPGVSQKAAQAAIQGDQSCVADMCNAYRERRDIAAVELAEAGMLVSKPQGAFYTMADTRISGLGGYELCRLLVEEHGVAVAPGETFGVSGGGFVRVSLAAADHHVREGVHRLVAAVGGLGG